MEDKKRIIVITVAANRVDYAVPCIAAAGEQCSPLQRKYKIIIAFHMDKIKIVATLYMERY